jgi:type II secretory pathway component PulK
MNRRGFALLAVLWLITSLSLLAATGLITVRQRLKASANRVTLTRADWAREACVEIMLARGFARSNDGQTRVASLSGRVDLGRNTWCELDVTDPGGRLNLNLASEASLRVLLQNDSLTDALLDWRDKDDIPRQLGAEADWYQSRRKPLPRNGPLASLDELMLVRGFEFLDEPLLAATFGVRGRGTINLNAAPPEVLRAALEFPNELIQLVHQRNRLGRPVESLDQLISLASPSQRPNLASRYQDLVQLLAFGPGELIVVATAGVGLSPLRSRITLTVVPTGGRVAVIRREVE